MTLYNEEQKSQLTWHKADGWEADFIDLLVGVKIESCSQTDVVYAFWEDENAYEYEGFLKFGIIEEDGEHYEVYSHLRLDQNVDGEAFFNATPVGYDVYNLRFIELESISVMLS